MPAIASAFGSRSCKVRKARSALRHAQEAARLRRIGRDMADAEMRQGGPAGGLDALRHRLPGLGRMEIVAAAVGIERAEQAVLVDHLGQRAKARGRIPKPVRSRILSIPASTVRGLPYFRTSSCSCDPKGVAGFRWATGVARVTDELKHSVIGIVKVSAQAFHACRQALSTSTRNGWSST